MDDEDFVGIFKTALHELSSTGVPQPMAHPRTLALAVLLGGVLIPTGPVEGRQADGEGEGGVSAFVEPTLQLTRVVDQARFMAGGFAGLQMTSVFRVGGGGFLLFNEVELPEGDPRMSFGYGGVLLGVGTPENGDGLSWSGGALLGAGTVRVRSPSFGAELGSNNVLVLEPRGEVVVPVEDALTLTLGAGYRLLSPVTGVPGVRTSDLHGFGISASIRLTHSP